MKSLQNSVAIFSCLFALCGTVYPGAASPQVVQNPKEGQADQPAVFKVPKGETVRIDRHDVCRMVSYGGDGSLMVSSRVPGEWIPTQEGSFLWALTQGQQYNDINATECPPRLDNECFFWVSGLGASDINHLRSPEFDSETGRDYYEEGWTDAEQVTRAKIGDVSMTWPAGPNGKTGGSAIVGEGDYPDSYGTAANPGPFHLAHNGTFDSIAVGKDTTVTLYSGKNFTGNQITAEGPVLLVNLFYVLAGGGYSYFYHQWPTADWGNDPSNILTQFTPETRKFIYQWNIPPVTAQTVVQNGMPVAPHGKWPLMDFGQGSVKVTCN